ncbi:alkaline phosphatase family protein [Microlunatus flavus]|uniref:40-residue YVTN family beta-propeller repeat-containing protein n=1 Tax=Microlunatus flavus TaxID=1036181 RepID=A0A1H9CK77_9ACTN|nr:alkaline phosphatase family protein [Microlunatus flavus]SEQ01471.1 40-residue YVTN family beta-propeller repeat-containing protein [Microlunatus flavus]
MQVTRRRRTSSGSAFLRRRPGRLVLVGVAALAVAGSGAADASTVSLGQQQVGSTYATGLQISSDQSLKPLGQRLVTKYGKFMGSAVSPDGRFLAASSADSGVVLQVFDLAAQKPVWLVGSQPGVNTKLDDRTVGQEGPSFSPDGKQLWLPQANGFTRFDVQVDGSLTRPTTIALPTKPITPDPNTQLSALQALPGKATFSPDGTTVFAPLNGQNTVVAIDAATGAVKRTWQVGIAPRAVVLVGTKLYVSNEGGRQAVAGDTTIESYGTQVPANAFKGTSTSGTLSVIDTAAAGSPVAAIRVGLHPTAMYAAGNALFVTNTFNDTVSVVDTTLGKVVQTIATRPWESSNVGYSPTSVVLTRDGHLLVTLARANAVAVYRYGGTPQEPVSYLGLLPTDYFPADIAEAGGQVVVTNTRGIDARGPEQTISKGFGTVSATDHNTHSTTGSLTRFTLPTDAQIAAYTKTVFAQNGWTGSDVAKAGATKAAPVAVPKKIGDPSKIKHVFLLVKENRTYDQVYGDDTRGNGDPTLAQFGEKVTPNQHALARQFGLYDNFYDVGTNSAEGHNWVMQGDNPEYTESSAGEYLRSYDTENDVLGHQRSGFLWTAVQAAGGSVRNFGEFMAFENKPEAATWQQYYCASQNVDKGGDPAQLTDPAIRVDDQSPIPSLNAVSNHDAPQFDTAIPDQYRFQIWKKEFAKRGPASLNMMWLSSDHTGGPADPRAQVADGDLAVGKIVSAISHSRYWKDSAIFVVEDDSQDGVDHVDGHRAPVQIISPYAQHGKVDSTYYSQITMVRTIEQILGAAPLNQKVAAATPMYGAFTDKPDLTPFTAVPNRVPLTEGLVTQPSCGTDTLGKKGAAAKKVRAESEKAAAVPAAQQPLAKAWEQWSQSQHLTGNGAIPDYAHPEQLNRYTWYQTHGWVKPYPGDDKLYAPADVPGADIPGVDGDR